MNYRTFSRHCLGRYTERLVEIEVSYYADEDGVICRTDDDSICTDVEHDILRSAAARSPDDSARCWTVRVRATAVIASVAEFYEVQDAHVVMYRSAGGEEYQVQLTDDEARCWDEEITEEGLLNV